MRAIEKANRYRARYLTRDPELSPSPMLGMAREREQSKGRKEVEGEKESKKLIEFHRGLAYIPLPPSYTHTRVVLPTCVRRRGRIKGVSVCSRNTSTSMLGKGRNSRSRALSVSVYFRVEPAAYLRLPATFDVTVL